MHWPSLESRTSDLTSTSSDAFFPFCPVSFLFSWPPQDDLFLSVAAAAPLAPLSIIDTLLDFPCLRHTYSESNDRYVDNVQLACDDDQCEQGEYAEVTRRITLTKNERAQRLSASTVPRSKLIDIDIDVTRFFGTPLPRTLSLYAYQEPRLPYHIRLFISYQALPDDDAVTTDVRVVAYLSTLS